MRGRVSGLVPNKPRPRCPSCEKAMDPVFRKSQRGRGYPRVANVFWCEDCSVLARGRTAPSTCMGRGGDVPRREGQARAFRLESRKYEPLWYLRRPAPWVTLWLCFAIFVMLVLQFAVLRSRFAEFYPDVFTLRVDWWVRPWTLVTSRFSHQGPVHLWVNFWGLIVLGPLAERWLGRRRFLGVFLGFGVAASLVGLYAEALFSAKGSDASSLGSSSAIWALIGVVLVGLAVRWHRGLRAARPLRERSFVEVVWMIVATRLAHEIIGGVVVVYLLSDLVAWESYAPGIGRVGNTAHLAGLLLGGGWAAWWFARSREGVGTMPSREPRE